MGYFYNQKKKIYLANILVQPFISQKQAVFVTTTTTTAAAAATSFRAA